jgi:protein transport protein SEC61 subunit alpha
MLFSGAQKLLGMVITLGEAVAYVASGMYGDINYVGAGNAILTIIQLSLPASMCLCSMKSCNRATASDRASRSSLQPTSARARCGRPSAQRPWTPARVQSLWGQSLHSSTCSSSGEATSVPSPRALVRTFPPRTRRFKDTLGHTRSSCSTPRTCPSFCRQHWFPIYFFSQSSYRRFKSNMIVNLLGQWQEIERPGQSFPVGGIVYYISPPTSS